MQAYKLTGKVDRSGKLIITEPTNLNPGDVEVIILQSTTTTENQLFDDRLHTAKSDKILKMRVSGIDEGRFAVPDDFDDPLPPDILKAFDRLLIAQSQINNLPIITADTKFNLYNVNIIW